MNHLFNVGSSGHWLCDFNLLESCVRNLNQTHYMTVHVLNAAFICQEQALVFINSYIVIVVWILLQVSVAVLLVLTATHKGSCSSPTTPRSFCIGFQAVELRMKATF